jgi:hypothetical protein
MHDQVARYGAETIRNWLTTRDTVSDSGLSLLQREQNVGSGADAVVLKERESMYGGNGHQSKQNITIHWFRRFTPPKLRKAVSVGLRGCSGTVRLAVPGMGWTVKAEMLTQAGA